MKISEVPLHAGGVGVVLSDEEREKVKTKERLPPCEII